MGIAIFTLIGLMALYLLFLRYVHFTRERHRTALEKLWRPLFIRSTESVPENIPQIATKDWPILFNLWNHFHETLTGQAKKNLNDIALRMGMVQIAHRMLNSPRTKERMSSIVALGLLRDKSIFEQLKSIAMEDHPTLSTTALNALVRIDDEEAMPFIIPLISSRTDWPISRIAGVLLDACPNIVCSALENALLNSPEEYVPRIVRLLGLISCNSSAHALRTVMQKYPNESILAASLRSLNDPASIDLVRNHLNHAAWYVRVQAAKALGRMGTSSDKYLLINMLSDVQWWVRYRAAQALADLPSVDLKELEQIKRDNTDRFAKDIIAQVIAEKTIS